MMSDRYRGTMYIGVTASLPHRTMQHRLGEGANFAQKYGCTSLVHVERCDTIEDAITREKRLKKWNRDWKIRLFEEDNPNWRDLFEDMLK